MENEEVKINNNEELNNSNKYLKKVTLLNFNNSIEIKSTFREIRTLKSIYKKSIYLNQCLDIKLKQKSSTTEIEYYYNNENNIDLYTLIKSSIFDYREQRYLVKWILFQVLKGLETLHSLNIIHRNLNPKTILISSQGDIKLTEFSNSINDIEAKFVSDKIKGELCYIAPEILSFYIINNKIDLWNVGILMLELYYKKTNILKFPETDNINNYSQKFFMQIKLLSNYFKIPFNLNYSENINQNEELIDWLKNAKIEQEKFNEILEDNPEIGNEGIELLKRLLDLNPRQRITAKEALKMEYFNEFQSFNVDQYKKNKSKSNNSDLPIFLKNLEKEFQKVDAYPFDKKIEIFKKEINNIFEKKA